MIIDFLNVTTTTPEWLHESDARDGKNNTTRWEATICNYKSATSFDRNFQKKAEHSIAGDVLEYGENVKQSRKYTKRFRTYAFVIAGRDEEDKWTQSNAEAKVARFLLLACYDTANRAIKGKRAQELVAALKFMAERIEDLEAMTPQERTKDERFELEAARHVLKELKAKTRQEKHPKELESA